KRGTAAHVCGGRAQRGERLRTFAQDARKEGNGCARLRRTCAERGTPSPVCARRAQRETRPQPIFPLAEMRVPAVLLMETGPDSNSLRPYLIENPACLFWRVMASRVP